MNMTAVIAIQLSMFCSHFVVLSFSISFKGCETMENVSPTHFPVFLLLQYTKQAGIVISVTQLFYSLRHGFTVSTNASKI